MAASGPHPDAGAAAAAASAPAEDGHTHESACLNCGATLTDEYCHRCGQRAHVHRTMGAFFHDLLHGVLHFEGKTWRTLPMLAWRPGELTRRYIRGERARFVSPLALFLFSVFLMFAVFSSLGGSNTFGLAGFSADFAEQIKAGEQRIKAMESLRKQAAAEGRSTAAYDQAIGKGHQQLSTLRTMDKEGFAGSPPRSEDDIPDLLRPIVKKLAANPALVLYKLQSNAYKYSWALIPISLPFLWLLFLHKARYRREHGAYDHVVFITYSIAFISLVAIVLGTLRSIGVSGQVLLIALAVIAPVHLFRQLQGAYRLSWISALWRTAAMLAFAIAAFAIFLMLLLGLGALG